MVLCGVVPDSSPTWSLSKPVFMLKIMYSLKYLTDADPRKPHKKGAYYRSCAAFFIRMESSVGTTLKLSALGAFLGHQLV